MADEIKGGLPGLGPIKVGVTPDYFRGLVHLEFGKMIDALHCRPSEAIQLGKVLIQKAEQVVARNPKLRS